MDYILHLWLKEVPIYTTGLCQLVLICSLVSTLSNLLAQVARAYGKIRNYQLAVSFILFLNFPLSYIVLKLGFSPLATMSVNIGIQVLLLFVRLRLTGKMIQMTCMDYVTNVLVKTVLVTIASLSLPVAICYLVDNSFLGFMIVSIVSFVCVCTSIYYLGINKNERMFIANTIFKLIDKMR